MLIGQDYYTFKEIADHFKVKETIVANYFRKYSEVNYNNKYRISASMLAAALPGFLRSRKKVRFYDRV